MADLKALEGNAQRFRAAIVRCDRLALPICMQDFPKGACGDATLLLGTFLIESGLGHPNYILGLRSAGERQHSHAWLEIGRIIVDITADQFGEVYNKVIVTRFSPWHQSFSRELHGPADYRIYDAYTVSVLGQAYRTILDSMTD